MANENARKLRKRMTPQEVKFWVCLRSLRKLGYHFRRQSPLPPYIVDFECRRSRLVIEVDGGQHNTNEGHRRDGARARALEGAGYTIIRFWNNEIDHELDAVMETILQALRSDNIPHPAAARPPSPERGGRE